jgi:PIN domain nuclease of toxin-antitoxin system
MILLDTHIWIWWVSDSEELRADVRRIIESHASNGLGVSTISCWEVAKLVERERLRLTIPTRTWLDLALTYPFVQKLELSTEIIVTSTELPGDFHRDPADQLLVATALVFDIPIITMDTQIRAYRHIVSLPSG